MSLRGGGGAQLFLTDPPALSPSGWSVTCAVSRIPWLAMSLSDSEAHTFRGDTGTVRFESRKIPQAACGARGGSADPRNQAGAFRCHPAGRQRKAAWGGGPAPRQGQLWPVSDRRLTQKSRGHRVGPCWPPLWTGEDCISKQLRCQGPGSLGPELTLMAISATKQDGAYSILTTLEFVLQN